jgi:hypothetical protein
VSPRTAGGGHFISPSFALSRKYKNFSEKMPIFTTYSTSRNHKKKKVLGSPKKI